MKSKKISAIATYTLRKILNIAKKSEYSELLLVTDNSTPMFPFYPLIKEITRKLQTATNNKYSHKFDKVQVCNFCAYPMDHVYLPGPKILRIDDLITSLHEKVLVLIIGTAFDASWDSDYNTIDYSQKFLNKLKPHVGDIIWLNPMPKYRWTRAANCIAEIVNMQEILRSVKRYSKETLNSYPFTNRYLQSFTRKYSEAALTLASYAVFPRALTPELLYLIAERFVPEADVADIADVLLSLFHSGQYCFLRDRDMRYELLQFLKQEQGEQRLKELADFISGYINDRLPIYADAAEYLGAKPFWTLWVLIDKSEEVIKALAAELYSNPYDLQYLWILYALASDYESFLKNNLKFQSLFSLIIGYHLWAYSYNSSDQETYFKKGARKEFGKLGKPGQNIRLAGFDFFIPLTSKLETGKS